MHSTRLRHLLQASALFSFFLLASGASAQTVVSNPGILQFSPSSDHGAVLTDGRPVVDHYTFDVYSIGASQPFQSSNIGKPAPAADGYVYYDFSSGIASWPLPGGDYEGRVAAVGPSGSGVSDPSNPFTFDSCSYALSGTSASMPAVGGGTQVGVTTAAGCPWTATSDSTWVALTPASASGSATVVATVAANTGTTARAAQLTVAGKSFAINQQGAAAVPAVPSGPSPANGAGNANTSLTLTWTAAGATTYTIRFGTVNPPPQVASGLAAASYTPAALATATTYYWQVIAVNAAGSTEGPVWSFSTTRRPRKK